MDEIDNLTNNFNNCNISHKNNPTSDVYKFYFYTMIEKMKINNEIVKCNCSNNIYFIITQYCTMGHKHEIIPNYNIIYGKTSECNGYSILSSEVYKETEKYRKNFLYYSYDDFIGIKPYIVI